MNNMLQSRPSDEDDDDYDNENHPHRAFPATHALGEPPQQMRVAHHPYASPHSHGAYASPVPQLPPHLFPPSVPAFAFNFMPPHWIYPPPQPPMFSSYPPPAYFSPGMAMAPIAPMAMPGPGPSSYEQLLALDDNVSRPGLPPGALQASTFTQHLEVEDAARLSQQHGRCVICLDDFEAGNTVRRLPCLCVFHVACADRHFQDSKSCPVCRTAVLSDSE